MRFAALCSAVAGAGFAALVLIADVSKADRLVGQIGDSAWSPGVVSYHLGDGEVETVVWGNPFLVSAPEAEASVRAALRAPTGFSRAKFVRSEEAEAGRGARLVFVFNPENPNINGFEICRELNRVETKDRDETSAGPVDLRIFVAFCHRDKLARESSPSWQVPHQVHGVRRGRSPRTGGPCDTAQSPRRICPAWLERGQDCNGCDMSRNQRFARKTTERKRRASLCCG